MAEAAALPGPAAPPAGPPHLVRPVSNVQHWDAISFLHWPYDPGSVQALLPAGLEVLVHREAAWVGVTPFRIRVRPPGMPTPPGWAFPETNVRTYVTDEHGRQGIWFLHMEVTAGWFAAALRSIGLPYVRQRMGVRIEGGQIAYRSTPAASPGGHDIVVRPGAALQPPSGGARERFLTARWAAYHRRGRALLRTPVEHPPWSLHRAETVVCEVDGLMRAAGLPAPDLPPLAHFSAGVMVHVGLPGVSIATRGAERSR